ncbi:CLUMA_CG014073, isoform A [Clunio marinus]|uniref:CLUMA_CG014073, isoform A n=1 Tax=Clunio marinus TaxID=568069 RepID=A0A1J1IP09_9DIPT|nr:CLUMA_CG014073, isoform A [Clunio marinus]
MYLECLNCDGESVNSEVKLKKKLFCDHYDKEIRPGPSSDVTKVNFRYTIKSFDYDENEKIFTVTAWMTLVWIDSRLSWEPSEYDDIKTIHMNIDYIWSPDIYLYNAHIGSGLGLCHAVDCLITAKSKVACVMPCEHIGHCSKGVYTNWPFDRHYCSFMFGSWMKSGEQLNFNEDKVKVISSKSRQNNQWKLLGTSVKVNEGKYDVSPNETYPSVYLSYLIERHSAYHIAGTIVPAFILMLCNVTVLWMIAEGIERFMLPFCGDSVPNSVNYFKDSHIISVVLLIETITLRVFIRRSTESHAYLWITNLVKTATTNRVGDFLLTSSSPEAEDVTDLVENVKKLSSNQMIWITFCKLIDRVIFTIIMIIYIIMFMSLLPEDNPTLSVEFCATSMKPLEVLKTL